MAEILTMGEIIVEIMRKNEDAPLDSADLFVGPFPSGAPAIFIDTAARLGHGAAIVGGVGNDDFGKCLLDRFERDGVETDYVVRCDNDFTGCAFVTYFGDGSRRFIFHIDKTAAVKAESPDISSEKDLKYFHIMGCSVMASPALADGIVSLAKQSAALGASISFDPNIRPELMKDESVYDTISEIIDMTEVFMPGREELLALSRCDDIESAVNWCFERSKMKTVVVKNGSKGCRVYTRDEVVSAGVYKIVPVDATGAGDSFDAAFICKLIEKASICDAVKYASAAAALNTAAFGPMEGKISCDEIEAFMNSNEIEVETKCRM